MNISIRINSSTQWQTEKKHADKMALLALYHMAKVVTQSFQDNSSQRGVQILIPLRIFEVVDVEIR